MDIQAKELQAMKDIVNLAVNIPGFAYPMYINATRPPGEYAGVRCFNSINNCEDEVRYTEVGGDTVLTTSGIRVLTFDILFSRDGQEYIDFDNAFYRPDVLDKCEKLGFGFMTKSPLDLANINLETNWEIRRAVRVTFNVLRGLTQTVGTMSFANVDGKFIDGDKTLIIKGY